MHPIISTLPKSGTGLLAAVFKAAKVEAEIGHFTYPAGLVAPRRAACLIRDPRDVAVSFARYFQSGGGGLKSEPYLQMSRDWHDLLAMVSVGILARRLSQIDRWVQASEVLTIRFEDIVGSRRGGVDGRQADTVRRLATWIHADEEALLSAFQADHKSRTLRRGQVGAWRDEMAPEIARGIEALNGELMARWGYL